MECVCKVSLLCSALYATCPYYVVPYMHSRGQSLLTIGAWLQGRDPVTRGLMGTTTFGLSREDRVRYRKACETR